MVIIAGWIAVQRNVLIDFNPEEYSLSIKTDSTLGSNDEVLMELYKDSFGDIVGTLQIYFYSTPQYWICNCNFGRTYFLTDLPSDNDKVWRVTLTRTSGIRLVVHCNEEEVVNILMSDSTCDVSDWSTYWSKEVAKIYFYGSDTASDYYQTQPGN